MKKLFSIFLALCLIFALAGCTAGTEPTKTDEPVKTDEPAKTEPQKTEEPAKTDEPLTEWKLQGYFSDDGDVLISITDMDGWYVGAIIGEEMYGAVIEFSDGALHGDINGWEENNPFVVTITENGRGGVILKTEDGKTYDLEPYEMPEAVAGLSANTEGSGWGQIRYAKEGETIDFDDGEYFTSCYVGLEAPETYILAARADEDSFFVKWTKDGEDYSAEPEITVFVDGFCTFNAVFEADYFSGEYIDPDIDEPALFITRNDDGSYGVKLSIYRLTELEGTGTVEDGTLYFTATDANGEPISGNVELWLAEAVVTFTDSTWPLIENGSTFTYVTDWEEWHFWHDDETENNPVNPYTGEFRCERAYAWVYALGSDSAEVVIEWGDSAMSLMRWDLWGLFDEETKSFEYEGCYKTFVTYNEEGDVVSEVVVSEDCSGTITFLDEVTFLWHDNQSEYGVDMTFEFVFEDQPGI